MKNSQNFVGICARSFRGGEGAKTTLTSSFIEGGNNSIESIELERSVRVLTVS